MDAARAATGGRAVSPDGGPELWVVDATALLFRAYYGVRPRVSPTGTPVGAVLGLASLLQQVLRRGRPEHVALVYDAGRTTFRSRIDPRYKAHRGEPPADLVPQFDLALALGEALGFATYSVPDYEADDLMATLARLARETGASARLVSVDKDLCQLVRDAGPRTVLEDPKTGAACDEAGVRARLGVAPAQVVDAMALIGDSSDNIAGVRGVGRRAAAALVAAFGDLDGIYADLARVEALALRGARGLARKLEAGRAEAYLARRLVRLCDAVPVASVPTAPGRAAAPRGAGDVRTATRWTGPRAEVDALAASLGARGLARGFHELAAGRGGAGRADA
jgi:DNA polymerase-1